MILTSFSRSEEDLNRYMFTKIDISLKPGLEKLTNANRSVSTGNGQLFLVELTEIADWESMSECMLHSNFGQKLTRVIGGNFDAYTFILPLSYFLNICLPFWMFYQGKEYFNKIKILRNFREQTQVVFTHSSGSVRVQSAK